MDASGVMILCRLCTDASNAKTYTVARDSRHNHVKTKMHINLVVSRDKERLEADLRQINAPPPALSAAAPLESAVDFIMGSDSNSDSPFLAFPGPDVNLLTILTVIQNSWMTMDNLYCSQLDLLLIAKHKTFGVEWGMN